MKRLSIMLLMLSMILGCNGCATYRTINPSIQGRVRAVELTKPIVISIMDGRALPDAKTAAKLKTSLENMYHGSIKWGDYFSVIPKGDIGIKIRIIELGSNFGSRILTSASYASAYSTGTASATGRWGAIAVDANSNQYLFAGNISTDGWWVGTAWIEVKIEDRRQKTPISFTIPLAAEDRKSNTWGYASGDKAAKAAWDRVSVQLTNLLDNIIMVLKENES